jgi:hypothetical protein
LLTNGDNNNMNVPRDVGHHPSPFFFISLFFTQFDQRLADRQSSAV